MKYKLFLPFILFVAAAITFSGCNNSDTSVYTVRSEQNNYSVCLLNNEAKTARMRITATKDGAEFAPAKITYASDDESIASVDSNGLITAVSAGETKISASFSAGGQTYATRSYVTVYSSASAEEVNTFDEAYVNLYGRTYTVSDKLVLDNAATAIEIAFFGTELTLNAYNAGGGTAVKFRCFIDGEKDGTETVLTGLSKSGAVKYKAAKGLEKGIHTAKIVKASSPQYGAAGINGATTDGAFLSAKEKPRRKIEFIGDSITAGFGATGEAPAEGTLDNSDCTASYAYVTAQELNADYDIIALEGICAKDGSPNMYEKYNKISVCNSTLSYDPSAFSADYVVLALGENDTWHASSTQFPYTMNQLKKDYAEMLQLVRTKHPDAFIICLYGMMESSDTYMERVLASALKAMPEDGKITTLHVSPNTTGGGFHPCKAAHRNYAEKLVEHILSL